MSDTQSSAAPAAPAPTATPAAPQSEVKAALDSKFSEPKGAASAPSPTAEVASLEAKKESGEKLTAKEEKKLKEYKLKVNGKDETISFDPFNDEEVTKHLQKSRASDEKFQEAASIRKAAMDFLSDLRKNPKKVLSDPAIGLDIRKFAEDVLNEEIKEMEKTPDQRAREKLQRELDEIREERKQEQEKAKLAEKERIQVEQQRILETDITAALDVGGIPKNPKTIARMADYMMLALNNGIDLSVKDIAPLVKRDINGELKDILGSLNDDSLEEFLGKDVIGRLRKKNVAKAKATIQTAASVKSTGASVKKEEPKAAQKISYKKFFGI